MSFFIRIVGSMSPNDWIAARTLIYMNDHNWHDALITQQADDTQLRNNEGPGMNLRLYIMPYVGGAANYVIFSHLDGIGKYATPRVDASYPLMDSPILSSIINLFAILTINLIDAYGQEYYLSYFGATSTGPIIYYLTLDYSPIMARPVLKCSPSINSPLSAFTFHYDKGTGPLIYGIPYYIKSRPQTIINGVHAGGYRLKATPDGKLLQVPDTDSSPATRFYFFPIGANTPATTYSIRSDFGVYVCITDTGKIEPRMAVGPWEQFEISRDWYVPGRFLITKRWENDPNKVYGLKYSLTDMSMSTWLVGSDPQDTNTSFQIHPVVAGSS